MSEWRDLPGAACLVALLGCAPMATADTGGDLVVVADRVLTGTGRTISPGRIVIHRKCGVKDRICRGEIDLKRRNRFGRAQHGY